MTAIMDTFKPRRPPLKEGRTSYPGLPNSGSTRRRLTTQQVAVIIVVLVLCPLFYFYTHKSDTISTTKSYPGANIPEPPRANAEPGPKVVLGTDTGLPSDSVIGDAAAQNPQHGFVAPPPPSVQDQVPVLHEAEDPVAGQSKGYGGEAALDESTDSKSPVRLSQQHSVPSTSKIMDHFSERPRFEAALAKVINLLPGEMNMRDLLRPVEGTGKEKLREMGLRTRAYRTFFQAWEDLHMTEDAEGGFYVRDDVVQYIRSHQHNGEGLTGLDALMSLGEAEIIRKYESYRYFLAKFGQLLFPWTAPYFSDHMSLHAHFKRGGRGIVLTAGDDQAAYLLTTIATFRKLGCNLPIEVMYLGDSDLSEDFRSELEALDGVVTRDIAQMVNDEGWKLAGWAAKPFAMLFSSFREVIFIDADSLFFKNPEVLFDDPGYKKTGALFFKDRLIMPENKKRWLQQILPKPISRQVKQSRFWTGDSGHMQESGVVVVDKWKHMMALLLVTRMNGPDRDGNKDEGRVGVYDMVYGDKETFWIGWELVGDMDYHFHAGDAGIMGKLDPERQHEAQQRKKERAREERRKKIKQRLAEKKEGEEEHPDGEENHDDEHKDEEPLDEEDFVLIDDPNNPDAPDNYTICAPQLLHLDDVGQPLWFNGWLLDNKFADNKQKKFGQFDHYLIEPRDIRDPGAWQLEEHNSCCLTTDKDKMRHFSDHEKELLQMFMEKAREVNAPGS